MKKKTPIKTRLNDFQWDNTCLRKRRSNVNTMDGRNKLNIINTYVLMKYLFCNYLCKVIGRVKNLMYNQNIFFF